MTFITVLASAMCLLCCLQEMGLNLAIQIFVRQQYWQMYVKYVHSHTQSLVASRGKAVQQQGSADGAQDAAVPVSGEEMESKEDSASLRASSVARAPFEAEPGHLSTCLLDEALVARGEMGMGLSNICTPWRCPQPICRGSWIADGQTSSCPNFVTLTNAIPHQQTRTPVDPQPRGRAHFIC